MGNLTVSIGQMKYKWKINSECSFESVNTECDDHFCVPAVWSCGDGQCLNHRLEFQRVATNVTCHSRRDQYFICETDLTERQWTMDDVSEGIDMNR